MAFIPRIYISEEGTPGGRIFVGGGDASHILRVLRRGKGDGIFVCDTRSVSYDAVIDEVTPEGFYAVLGQPRVRDAEPVCPVTLYQCLPKGEKTDDLVRRAVELGATRIVAVISERCVARPDGKSFAKRLERLNRISESAAAQCGRASVPPVCGLISYREAVAELAACGLGFICYEGDGTRPLRGIIEGSRPESIGFLIGPEGGLSDSETALALERGLPLAGLGRRIMRTETASAYVLSAIDILL